MVKNVTTLLSFLLLGGIYHAHAQVSHSSLGKNGSIYLSAGINIASFSNSTIHIKQNGGNAYDMVNVAADEEVKGSTSISDYSFRLGYFFNTEQTLGFEINYDPAKYHVTDGQTVQLKGTMASVPVDKSLTFAAKDGYYYYLGGSNLVLVNFVGRYGLLKNKMNTLRVDALGRIGVGPTMPRVDNSLDSNTMSTPSFVVNGWNAAAEGALRITVARYVFVEASAKYDYASYSSLDVHTGTASQNVKTTLFVFTAGITFPTTRHNPLFEKVHKQKRVLTIKPMNQSEDDPTMMKQ